MKEAKSFYIGRLSKVRYPIGDLYAYPDSLIRARTSAAYNYGVTLLGDRSVSKALDFGSGGGHGVRTIIEGLHPQNVVSLDIYFPYLQAQRMALNPSNHILSYVNASVNLPFADGSFDLLTCMHVIEHMKEPDQLLLEFHRILARSGILLLATPSKHNLAGKNSFDEYIFVENELTELLKKCCFKPDVYFLTPNEKARKVHERKKWLAIHAPFTAKLRNHINPQLWDQMVLRFGISRQSLTIHDFTLSKDYNPNAIDLVAVASKTE